MTSIQNHHLVTHSSSSGPNLDNHIDALLDDLQSGVGPRGDLVPHHSALVNGGSINLPAGASGYRETTTTVTRERNGVPMTSRDYQIEYLNPANSVTVLSERGGSPNPETFTRDGAQVSSLKKSSYEYKYSTSSSDGKGNLQPVDGYSISKAETVREGNRNADGSLNRLEGTNLNRNLNELDSLLYELNTAQRTPNPPRRAEHSSRSIDTRVQRDYQQNSTPRSASLTRDAQKEFNQYSSETPGTPRAQHRDYQNFSNETTGTSRTQHREYQTFETTGTPRTQHREYQQNYSSELPGTPRAPQRGVNVNREVTSIEHRSHTSRRDSPGPGSRDRSLELSPTLRRRTPSPSGEFRPVNFHSYPHSPHETRSRSQTRWEESSSSQTQSQHQTDSKYRTTYVNHASTARTDDAQPYRSPSPVSFPQKRSPSPVRRAVSRSDSGRTLTYQVSPNQSQPYQQPPLSDPSSPTVITYKYSSHSSQHNKYPGEPHGSYANGTGPMPFPTPAPIQDPGDQSPPKKLDDLMASFQDNKRTYTTTEQYYREEENRRHHNADLQRSPSFERNIRPSNVKATQIYQTPQDRVPTQAPVHEVVPPPSPPPQNKQQLARSVAGPPVYYPPGVELFAKKEEAHMEQESAGGKGKMKGKAKMKYKYEASEKSKEKKSSGVTAVPVCLPLCCAMPCSIM